MEFFIKKSDNLLNFFTYAVSKKYKFKFLNKIKHNLWLKTFKRIEMILNQ